MIRKNTSFHLRNRIGVLGGTFDPIHNGHLAMASSAIACGAVDRIWFLPNPLPPHKALPQDAATAAERVAMLKLAIKGISDYEICDLELLKGNETYTYQTLPMLEERYPELFFTFMIGADSLFQIETWKCPKLLLSGHTFLAACRDDHDNAAVLKKAEELNRKYGSNIQLLKIPPTDVSSTRIREKCRMHESIASDVPDAVAAYIANHGLYQEGSRHVR